MDPPSEVENLNDEDMLFSNSNNCASATTTTTVGAKQLHFVAALFAVAAIGGIVGGVLVSRNDADDLVVSSSATEDVSRPPSNKPTVLPSLAPTLASTATPTFEVTLGPAISPTLEVTLATAAPSSGPTNPTTTAPTPEESVGTSPAPTLDATVSLSTTPTLEATPSPLASSGPSRGTVPSVSTAPTRLSATPTVAATIPISLTPTLKAASSEPSLGEAAISSTAPTLSATDTPIPGATISTSETPTTDVTTTTAPSLDPTLVASSGPIPHSSMAPTQEDAPVSTTPPTLVISLTPTTISSPHVTVAPTETLSLATANPTTEDALAETSKPSSEPTLALADAPSPEPTSLPSTTSAPEASPFPSSVPTEALTDEAEFPSFEGDAALLLSHVASTFEQTVDSLASLSANITSLMDAGFVWPFVTDGDFFNRVDATLTDNVLHVQMLPIVNLETRSSWEAYSVANQGWIADGFEHHNIFEMPDPIASFINTIDDTGTVIPFVSQGSVPMLPIWQSSPLLKRLLVNYNLLSHPYYADLLQTTLGSSRVTLGKIDTASFGSVSDPDLITSFLADVLSTAAGSTVDYSGNPMQTLSVPIKASLGENGLLVAVLVATLQWETYFETTTLQELVLVLEDECGHPAVSYRLLDGLVEYLGTGNLADPSYEKFKVEGQVGSSERIFQPGTIALEFNAVFCPKSVSIYPG